MMPSEKTLELQRPTVGFSGSGGEGKTPLPKFNFAGSRRVPWSGEALSAAHNVSPLSLASELPSA